MTFVWVFIFALLGLLCCKRTRGVVGIVLLAVVVLAIAKRVALVSTSMPRITINAPRNLARVDVVLPPSTLPTTQASNLWLEDWNEFVRTSHWRGFRAESSDTCATEAEARQQVIADAANSLSWLAVGDPAFAADAQARDAVVKNLKTQLIPRLQSGDFIADQFDRKTEKSYGTLYKTYLLIDTHPANLAPIQQAARKMLSQMKANEVTAWGSLAALGVVIILLYAFLNAATKGYFVWKLRAAAMMTAIIALLAVFAWSA